jgi:CHAT domain-containing protein
VVETRAVSYAPNATLAERALRQAWTRPERVAAVFDPQIDAATDEIGEVTRAPGAPAVRAVATHGLAAETLHAELAAAPAAHLLMHGMFAADEPLLSTLTLSAAGGAKLPASELVGWPVRHLELAVLSACESGEVGVTLANEIFGIPWALLVGGAKRVVLSRWRVDAASNARWMSRFYAAIGAGERPAVAAALAMRAMLAREATAHPYFWAAPQVTGR